MRSKQTYVIVTALYLLSAPIIATVNPSTDPTIEPTVPTLEPTIQPSTEPTNEPTNEPTSYPTPQPTGEPLILSTDTSDTSDIGPGAISTHTVRTLYIILWIFYLCLAIVVCILAFIKSGKQSFELQSIDDIEIYKKKYCRGQCFCGGCIGSMIGFLFLSLIPMVLIDYDLIENSQSTTCEITSVTDYKNDAWYRCTDDDGTKGTNYGYDMIQENGEPFDNGCASILYFNSECDVNGPNYVDGDIIDCISYPNNTYTNEYYCDGDVSNDGGDMTILIVLGIIGFLMYLVALYLFFVGFSIWRNIGCFGTTICSPKKSPVVEREINVKKEQRVEMQKMYTTNNGWITSDTDNQQKRRKSSESILCGICDAIFSCR